MRVATPLIEDLAQQSGHTVAIAVWGTHGPTIVRLAESPAAVHVNMRHGTVFSLANTASGRLFAAFQAPAVARAHLERERERHKAQPDPVLAGMPPAPPVPGWKVFEAQLVEVRTQGLSRSVGEVVPGVNAMAAPVFDHTGALVLAITAIDDTTFAALEHGSVWAWGRNAKALRERAAPSSAVTPVQVAPSDRPLIPAF